MSNSVSSDVDNLPCFTTLLKIPDLINLLQIEILWCQQR